MKLDVIHHVAIIASDYEKSKEFYVNLLGFEVIREVYRPERNDHILNLKLGDAEIELFGMPNPPARVTNPEACGLRHLAFRVADAQAVAAELNALGIETEPIRVDPYTGGKMTFFRDPDGLPLEIHE